MDYILIFKNTHDALYCEKLLIEMKISINIIPTPSNVARSCGISIGINYVDLDQIKKGILDNKIRVKEIYDVKKNTFIVL